MNFMQLIDESNMDLQKAKQSVDGNERTFIDRICSNDSNFITNSNDSDTLATLCIDGSYDSGDRTKDQIYETASNFVEELKGINETVRGMTLSIIREWYYNN